jgi:hypothetical protein
MNNFTKFFLFCSGANKSLLRRSPSDINKYAGIGATVFFTGVLATLAGAYAIYTVFHSWIPALFFGLIWGAMIFNLDRYLVSSMKSRGNIFKDFGMAFPRILLAILIALVISKPLELKIFDSEIQAELVSMEQEKFKEHEDKTKQRFESDIKSLDKEIINLKSSISQKESHRDELALMALQEADGTGGSMEKNLGPIYKAKKEREETATIELEALKTETLPLINQKQAEKDAMRASLQSEIATLRKTELNGFAARLNALSRLASKSEAIFWASIFITLLFIAIECAPILVKLISYRSPYDFVLHKHEHAFEMSHKEHTSLLQNLVYNRVNYDTQTSSHKTKHVIQAENKLIEHLVKEEMERLKENPISWKEFLNRGKIFGIES